MLKLQAQVIRDIQRRFQHLLSFQISDLPKPQLGKSAPIQKGLIPRLQGNSDDLCGEGLGFGTPILQYRRDFYFPGTGTVTQEDANQEILWRKTFNFNLIERKQRDQLGTIDTFSWALPRLHNQMYKMKTGRYFLKLVALLNRWGFQRYGREFAPQLFLPVQSRGESHSQFRVTSDDQVLDTKLSFDTIVRNNLQFIYIANELGGRYFTHYYDGSGIHLVENHIEPWARIEGPWAAFYAPSLNFGFRLEIPEGIKAFRGREVFEGHEIFWAGIILRLPKSTTTCSYRVRFGSITQIMEGPRR